MGMGGSFAAISALDYVYSPRFSARDADHTMLQHEVEFRELSREYDMLSNPREFTSRIVCVSIRRSSAGLQSRQWRRTRNGFSSLPCY